MKKLFLIITILILGFKPLSAQNIPFSISEPSTFKALILNGNVPTTTPFTCVYSVDEKKSDWTGLSAKEKQQILNSTSFEIIHAAELTTCKLVCVNQRLTTYTENNSGESLLTYYGDTVAFKSVFTLEQANPSGQDITAEICNSGKYDYEGFNCYCNRFRGKGTKAHPEECMATTNFLAVNTIFNLYYGFEKPRYFPVTFSLIIKGHRIAFTLKQFTFETIEMTEMPHLEDFEVCKELNIEEFFIKTPELR